MLFGRRWQYVVRPLFSYDNNMTRKIGSRDGTDSLVCFCRLRLGQNSSLTYIQTYRTPSESSNSTRVTRTDRCWIREGIDRAETEQSLSTVRLVRLDPFGCGSDGRPIGPRRLAHSYAEGAPKGGFEARALPKNSRSH